MGIKENCIMSNDCFFVWLSVFLLVCFFNIHVLTLLDISDLPLMEGHAMVVMFSSS